MSRRSNFLSSLGRVGTAVSAPKMASTDAPDTRRMQSVSTEIQAKTEIFTYFTTPGETRLLYSAPTWVKIRLTLENAGPVSVGTKQIITPVLSGRGILLLTDDEITFTLPRGNRLFIAAESVNRVKVIVEPFAWLEQLYHASAGATSALLNILTRKGR